METVFDNFRDRLQKALPMDDCTFISKLNEKKLLPGNIKATVESKNTEADKASYFLEHVIKSSFKAGCRSDFNSLLAIMESSDFNRLNELCSQMKSKMYTQCSDTSTEVTSTETIRTCIAVANDVGRSTVTQEVTSSGLSKPAESQLLTGKSSQNMHAAVDTLRGPSQSNSNPLHPDESCKPFPVVGCQPSFTPSLVVTSLPTECTGSASATTTDPVDSTEISSSTVGTDALLVASSNSGSLLCLVDKETDRSETTKRICKAVSEYYDGQFVHHWKDETDSSTITVVSALLVEQKDDMKVVIFTAGTNVKGDCSYNMKSDDKDEIMWGICDGHSESVCFRLASMYLVTEIYKLHKGQESILKTEVGGFTLREDVDIHFFTTHPPCGFMAKKERHVLSWKRPFVGKPHCLQCSSTILISAYLGIQGPLSHLFNAPVCISSITLPKHDKFDTLHGPYIQQCFKEFRDEFSKKFPNDCHGYEVKIPHVQIAEIEPGKIFTKCYVPLDESCGLQSPATEQTKKEAIQTGGTIPDASGNYGVHAMMFTLEDGIGSHELRKKMLSQFEEAVASKGFPLAVKKSKFKFLEDALLKLSEVIDTSKALEAFETLLTKKMDATFITSCPNVDAPTVQLKRMEQHGTLADELTMQIKESDTVLRGIMAQFEKDCDMEKLVGSLSKDFKAFDSNAKLMINNLRSLNESLGVFKGDATPLFNKLRQYCKYQKMLRDVAILRKNDTSDRKFCTDLLGCDWARYLRMIRDDIRKCEQGLANMQTHTQ